MRRCRSNALSVETQDALRSHVKDQTHATLMVCASPCLQQCPKGPAGLPGMLCGKGAQSFRPLHAPTERLRRYIVQLAFRSKYCCTSRMDVAPIRSPTLAELGHNLASISPDSSDSGHVWPSFADVVQSLTKSGRVRPTWVELPQHMIEFCRGRPSLACIRPMSGDVGRFGPGGRRAEPGAVQIKGVYKPEVSPWILAKSVPPAWLDERISPCDPEFMFSGDACLMFLPTEKEQLPPRSAATDLMLRPLDAHAGVQGKARARR